MKILKLYICEIFGHKPEAWYADPAKVNPNHPWSDGFCCKRCKKVTGVYDKNDNLIKFK